MASSLRARQARTRKQQLNREKASIARSALTTTDACPYNDLVTQRHCLSRYKLGSVELDAATGTRRRALPPPVTCIHMSVKYQSQPLLTASTRLITCCNTPAMTTALPQPTTTTTTTSRIPMPALMMATSRAARVLQTSAPFDGAFLQSQRTPLRPIYSRPCTCLRYRPPMGQTSADARPDHPRRAPLHAAENQMFQNLTLSTPHTTQTTPIT